jgi:serine/threonine protein kinase
MFRPNADQFEKQYKVGPVLGKGGFGVVYAGVRCLDGHKVAIKHVAKLKIKEWGEVRDPSFIDISQVKSTALKCHSWIWIRIALRRIRIQKQNN